MSSTSGRRQKRRLRPVSGFDQLAGAPAESQEPSPEPAPETPTRPRAAVSRPTPPPDREPEPESPDEPAFPPEPRRKSRRWLFVGLVGMAIVLVWLIPTIASLPPVLGWILGMASSRLDGEVSVESASLSWLSPPAVSGVELRDPEGQPVLAVSKAAADRSLASLLWNWHELGTIRLEKPTLDLVLRDDGSNLEDVLADLLKPKEEPRQAPQVGVHLEIVDGTVSITHPRTQKAWRIERLEATVDVSADNARPLEAKVSGQLADAQPAGRFAAGAKIEIGDQTPPSVAGDAAVQVENLPLDMLMPLAARFAPGALTRTEGRLSTSLRGRFAAETRLDSLSVEGNATIDGLGVAAPALGSDQLALQRVETGCRLAYHDGILLVDRLSAKTDVAAVSLSGTLETAGLDLAGLVAASSKTAFDVQGDVDLAGLARLLPSTLHIRQGTEIVSGRLQLAASSRRQPDSDRVDWTGRLQASDLTAVAGGRRLEWKQPILVTLAAYHNAEGPFVDSLKCQSDFLTLDASGTPDKLTAQGSFDLSRLAAQLGQFVDLGGMRLAGDGWTRLAWNRAADHRFQTQGELRVKDFQFAATDRRPWIEPSLTATFSAAGRTDFAEDHRLDSATLEVTAGADPPDVIRAELLESVSDFGPEGSWPVSLRCQGQLARWLPRVSPWVDLDAWQLAGNYVLTARATGSTAALTASHVRLVLADLVVRGDKLNIRQPKAELLAAGSWDQDARRLKVTSATVTAGSLSAKATDVAAVVGEASEGLVGLAGKLECQASLAELAGWVTDPASPPPWRVAGQAGGVVEFSQSDGRIAATVEAAVNNLDVAHTGGNRFQQKQIRLKGRGGYDPAARLITLDEAAIVGGPVSAQAAGRIDGSADPAQVAFEGRVDYDLEQLSELARSYLGDGIYMSGKSTSPVSLKGPLALSSLEGQTKVGWTWGELYGFRLGQGEFQAALASGVFQLRPAVLDVSEGQLHVAAQVKLAAQPAELVVPAGPLVENVRINPRMCANGLQYIAPVLAGVATAEGRFSIEMEGCRIPLEDPRRGEAAGRMIIHSAQVGPGPLVRELATALGYKSPAQLADNSTIDFRMVDGRVYHRGVVVQFPDLTVRTYGSVGLEDKSLELMAEMPVPPKWLGTNRVVDKALRDQIVQLPIGGSLDRPRIDQQVLRQTSAKFLQKAAGNVIEDQLIRGLDRLLQPPK